ncbi:MAG: deaminase [Candidatus Sumerlaeia bacterium]|nr:deaminase [Candidatus Sumerlaeia bacterium]
MPEKVSIFVEGAPSPFGHFSQVIKYGNSLHISGQLPLDAETGKLVSPDVKEQSRVVFQHFTSIMQACAGQLSNFLSTRVYLIDLRDYKALDEVSREFFFFTPPARTVLQVAALPYGARVMIDAVAELNPVEMKGGSLL